MLDRLKSIPRTAVNAVKTRRFWDRAQVLGLYALFAVGAVWVLYVMFAAAVNFDGPTAPGQQQNRGGTDAQGGWADDMDERGPTGPEGFSLRQTAVPIDNFEFRTADQKKITLADFKGKIVLVNVWATWCAPCVAEMPALDALQAAFADEPFEVVAISTDYKGVPAIKNFFAKHDIENLNVYNDRSLKISQELAGGILPTTVLLNRQGREMGRIAGPAEWDSPAAKRLIRHALDR